MHLTLAAGEADSDSTADVHASVAVHANTVRRDVHNSMVQAENRERNLKC
jgi:hypothetical protein